jgi:hypothetical protein
MLRSKSALLCALHVLCVLSPAAAQCPGPGSFAAAVIQYLPGPAVGAGFADPTRILCAPAGFADVVTLGIGGSITVELIPPALNGPGTDFCVYENGFLFGGLVFGELAFVEVSTDGVHFARFPGRYHGPLGPLGPFDGLPPGAAENIAGLGLLHPVADPRDHADPARGGGDPFDLEDLLGHPLVQLGTVDLGFIRYVRLLDIEGSGATLDSQGVPIFDPTSPASSSDWDAIAVAHTGLNQDPGRPAVTVAFDEATRVLTLSAADADGVLDLDFAAMLFRVNEEVFDLGALLFAFPVQTVTPTSISIATPPIPAGVRAKVALSIPDLAGRRGADAGVIRP